MPAGIYRTSGIGVGIAVSKPRIRALILADSLSSPYQFICARYTTHPSTTPAATETGSSKPNEARSPAFNIISTISVRNATRGSSPKSWLNRPIDPTVPGFLLGIRWNLGPRGMSAERSICLPHLPQYSWLSGMAEPHCVQKSIGSSGNCLCGSMVASRHNTRTQFHRELSRPPGRDPAEIHTSAVLVKDFMKRQSLTLHGQH